MERLLEGVRKFQSEVFPEHQHLFEDLASRQNPEFLFITCADSRIVPDMITQTKPGDLFICRNAGNMVPPHGELHGGVSATIEYAVSALDVKHIIVCGHSDCGAMRALMHPEKVASLPAVKDWLAHGEVARRVVTDNLHEADEQKLLLRLTEENIIAQLDHLRTHPSVASKMARGSLCIHGWMYNIKAGKIDAWDPQAGRFVPIEQYKLEVATPRARLALAV